MDQDVLVWDEDFWDEDELVEDGYGIAVENNGPVTFRSPKNEWINFPPSAIDGVLIVKPGCFKKGYIAVRINDDYSDFMRDNFYGPCITIAEDIDELKKYGGSLKTLFIIFRIFQQNNIDILGDLDYFDKLVSRHTNLNIN